MRDAMKSQVLHGVVAAGHDKGRGSGDIERERRAGLGVRDEPVL